MRKLLRFCAVTLLGAHVLVNGIACDDDHDEAAHSHAGSAGVAGSAGGSGIDIEALVYEGEVTDEAAQSALGVAATVNDSKASVLSAPTEGQALPGATPFTFTWNAATAQRTRLPSWLGPERSAHAHGDPFTGVAYVLTFTAGGAFVAGVATDKTSYTPDEAAWGKLKAAGGPIVATLTVARMENNLVATGGGPYTSGKSVSFSVAP